MKMTEKYKILGKYIKDMSSETPDVETYIFVQDRIFKYQLNINIDSKTIKNKIVEININLKFEDKEVGNKKSHFEIVFSTVVKILDSTLDNKKLEKIMLCEVPNKVYPDLEKSFLSLLHNSGYPGVKLGNKIDFEKLFVQRKS